MTIVTERRTVPGGRRRKPPKSLVSSTLTDDQRRAVHMAASVLLDYPKPERRTHFDMIAEAVSGLPTEIAEEFDAFLAAAAAMSQHELEAHFTSIFDQKRKCCPYLTYYATGDTRRRGMALVGFIEAYRAAGWEVEEGELPDYLPMVLEFSALSESPIASQLLASYREGIEVLRTALETADSPYAHVVSAVCRSFPEIDDETRDRYLRLVNEGPPTEMVGVTTFLGALAPFSPSGAASEGVRV
ncbi:MAG: nitrate reductase molybdenum cofactor assembly chaperone [Microbacteriaceae bacterium]|nr:nitrate reductase molybdenum cofactor assembly chaperone [Microbacteriaceae bacterium]